MEASSRGWMGRPNQAGRSRGGCRCLGATILRVPVTSRKQLRPFWRWPRREKTSSLRLSSKEAGGCEVWWSRKPRGRKKTGGEEGESADVRRERAPLLPPRCGTEDCARIWHVEVVGDLSKSYLNQFMGAKAILSWSKEKSAVSIGSSFRCDDVIIDFFFLKSSYYIITKINVFLV